MSNNEIAEDLIWGRHSVLEALRAKRPLRRLLVAKGAHGPVIDEIFDLARRARIPYDLRDKTQLDHLAGPRHQSVVAYAAASTYADFDQVLSSLSTTNAFLIFLDQVQDPQNLGAIIRSAQALGTHALIIPEREAAGLSPATVKASAGAAQHLPICRVANLQKALQKVASHGLFIAGLDVEGKQTFTEFDFTQPCALVIGNEHKGLRRMVQKRCDALVHIPMAHDSIGSFNASVAAGIVLYEVFRQRQL